MEHAFRDYVCYYVNRNKQPRGEARWNLIHSCAQKEWNMKPCGLKENMLWNSIAKLVTKNSGMFTKPLLVVIHTVTSAVTCSYFDLLTEFCISDSHIFVLYICLWNIMSNRRLLSNRVWSCELTELARDWVRW